MGSDTALISHSTKAGRKSTSRTTSSGVFPGATSRCERLESTNTGGHTIFPLAAGDVRNAPAKTLSALLEIRIMRAVVTYQQRNILGYQYQVIPGFDMPRVLAIYGVRWDFWN